MSELSKGNAVYVLTEEAQAVIGEQGVITDTRGDLMYVSQSKEDGAPGLWLKPTEVSADQPAPAVEEESIDEEAGE